jgi:Zn-dependent protease with chaperone function
MQASDNLDRQVLEAFRGGFQPVKVGGFYKLGMFCVAVVMVVLPLIYVSLVVAAGWLLCWHATANLNFFNTMRPKAALFAYVVPLVILAILLFFMVKPLFAPRGKTPPRRTLRREDEPRLFAFIERICGLIRAPVPSEICVDSEVNASASFRRGIWSMFGRDLRLTIGLPLVANLSLPQFASILAHEFGHFAQGGGMRLTYIVGSVNAWFYRVVYERDAWDERLVEWSKNAGDIRLQIPFYIARFFVWLTRRILWGLMWIGHAVSCFMSRQMEYDADQYAAKLAGADAFAAGLERLPFMAVAHNEAASSLFGSEWKEGRLVDNFVAYASFIDSRMPEAARQEIAKDAAGRETGFFSTHPASADRIAALRVENHPGVFAADLPAQVLFRDFEATAKTVTRDWYEQLLGEALKEVAFVPVNALAEKHAASEAETKALGRWFQGTVSILRPLNVPSTEAFPPFDNLEQAAAALQAARSKMLAALPGYRESFSKFDAADTRLLELRQVSSLVEAGFRIDAASFNLANGKPETIGAARQEAQTTQAGADVVLASFEALHGARLAALLAFARSPFLAALAAPAGGAAVDRSLIADFESTLASCAALAPALSRLQSLRDERASLYMLLVNLEQGKDNETYVNTTLAQSRSLCRRIEAVFQALGDIPYPFEHAKGALAVRDYLLKRIPGENDVGEMFDASQAVLERLAEIHFRLFGQLAAVAEKMEAAAGLAPLPPPPEPKAAG